ncbi:hypothetical protein AAMO2058_000063800 [Amorphochlora amoebiformis]
MESRESPFRTSDNLGETCIGMMATPSLALLLCTVFCTSGARPSVRADRGLSIRPLNRLGARFRAMRRVRCRSSFLSPEEMAEVERLRQQMQQELGGGNEDLFQKAEKEERISEDDWQQLISERANEREANRKKMSYSSAPASMGSVRDIEQFQKIGRRRGINDGIPTASEDDILELLAAQQDASTEENQKLLIDVRDPDETASSMLAGAVNLPLGEIETALKLTSQEFEEKYGFPKIKNGDEIILYCQSGIRAGRSAMLLGRNGVGGVRIFEKNLISCKLERTYFDD